MAKAIKKKRKVSQRSHNIKQVRRTMRMVSLEARESFGVDDLGEPKIQVHHKIKGKNVRIGELITDCLLSWQWNWRIKIFAEFDSGIKGDSKRYYNEIDEIDANGYKLDELAEYAQPSLDAIAGRGNEKHLFDRGWIAHIAPNVGR